MTASDSKLLTPKEAAEMLQVSERTLFTLHKEQGLPNLRLGRQVRYDPEDIRKWINQQKSRGQNGD